MVKHIYLDNAATTPVAPEVVDAMTKQMVNHFGNASSTHWFGRMAADDLSQARHVIAQSLNVADSEVIFTSGATESNNTIIMGTAFQRSNLGKHIITTAIEHPSVLKPMAYLESLGFEVTYLPVDEQGHISIDDFKAALRPDTILVSIMAGNNEVGTKMPIEEIGEILKDHQAWFHTDATQAYGLIDLDVNRDHIDSISASAHKLNGPKGIGLLYERKGVNLQPYLRGGEQERDRRAGTENVPAIVGFAQAVKMLTPEEKQRRQNKYLGFKHYIIDELNKAGIDFEVNGDMSAGNLQHVFNLWIKGVPTEALQMNMDLAGFAISGGSACTAGNIEPSHVLVAMFGNDSPRIHESIRVSFGVYNTQEDIEAFTAKLIEIVKRLKK